MLRTTVIVYFISMIVLSRSQGQSPLLNQFKAIQSGNSVFLTFTLASGVTCLGIEIERSSDSMNFNTIGVIPGICGNSSEAVTYTFEDTAPLNNQENFYRLLLGQVGYSETIKIHFIDYDDGPVIFPNPIMDQSTIFFPNPTGETFVFSLYDSSGRIVTSLSTSNASISLHRNSLSSGIYFFILENKSERFQGKVVVQ